MSRRDRQKHVPLETFRQLGGRLTHYHDSPDTGGRVVTIAYWRDPQYPEDLYFAGAVFRPDHVGDPFTTQVRRQNTQTAIDRLLIASRCTMTPEEGVSIKAFLRAEIGDHYIVRGDRWLEDEEPLLQIMERAQVVVAEV